MRPAFASGSRILYMSSPSTPAANCLRLPSSSATRFLALGDHVGGVLAPDHHDAVIVGDHGIAGHDVDPGANHGHVDRAQRRLHRALGRDRLRPHRKAHFAKRFGVANAGVDDEPLDAARHQRGRRADRRTCRRYYRWCSRPPGCRRAGTARPRHGSSSCRRAAPARSRRCPTSRRPFQTGRR